jgi:ribosome biogenesis protein MAK21
LKGLNLGGHGDPGTEPVAQKSSKVSDKSKKGPPAKETPSKKKGRTNTKTDVSASAVATEPKSLPSKKKGRVESKAPKIDVPVAAVEESKVQLPTKVTLDPKSHFIFTPVSQWYLSASPLGATSTSLPVVTAAQLALLTTRASNLHTTDIYTFQTSSSSNSSASEANFLSKIIQSGTLSDRLSALTLLVQSSPLHNTKALETLKGMAERGKGKGGREESLKALRCIVDWWVGGGAPDRKLK